MRTTTIMAAVLATLLHCAFCVALEPPDGSAVNAEMRAHDVAALRRALETKAAALRDIIDRHPAPSDLKEILRQLQRSRVATNDIERAGRRLLSRPDSAGSLAGDARALQGLEDVRALLQGQGFQDAVAARHDDMDQDDLRRALTYDTAALAALKPLFERPARP